MHNNSDSAIQRRGGANQVFCYYCSTARDVVWVHGHGQCAVCKINIDECCRGEACAPMPGQTATDNEGMPET